MNKIFEYIESHLYDRSIIKNLPAASNYSLMQLYRDFHSRTGHSIKKYIRKRRISNACEKIKCSAIPLAIIAEESGYQTQQAFHRQFKSIVGMTPIEYKRGGTYFFPYPVNENNIAVRVEEETIPACTTKRFYDSKLIGIEDKTIASLGEINGRVFGKNGKQAGTQFCYEVMTSVGDDAQAGQKTYATCVVDYNEQDINDGWNYLYNVWLVSTADLTDRDGARCLIGYAYPYLSKVQKVLVDGAYTGDDFAQDVKWLIGADVEVVKRNELHTFEVLPKRWIVERSFAWLDNCRRLWKNCERLLHTSLQMANLAFISLLLFRY